MYTKGDLLQEKWERVRRLTEGLKVSRHKLVKYYFSLFMIRRSIFCMIPVIFYNYQGFQVMNLIWFQQMFMMILFHIKPFESFKTMVLEFVNEVIIMITFYHMAIFSEFPLDSLSQFNMGYSFVVFMLLMVVININFVVFKMVKEYRKNKAMKAKSEILHPNSKVVSGRESPK